jgi:hypothetical protein
MPIEAIAAGFAFVGLFVTWVVLPSRIRNHHSKMNND